MNSDLKRKLDDLNELLSQNYITDTEYAIARENVLADAGIDIVPRMDGPVVRDNVRPLRPRREPRSSGCGCFLVLLLLLVAAAGCLLALPEDIAKKIPGVGQLMDAPRYQDIRQSITQFIDDLRGNPAPAPAPVLTPEPASDLTAQPSRVPGTSNFSYTAAPDSDKPISTDSPE